MRVSRVASSARRGLTCRSRYNANCLRRNRFSAASCACERNMDEANRRTSAATQRIVRTKTRERDWVMPPDGTPAGLSTGHPLYIHLQHDWVAAAFVNSLQEFLPGSTHCQPQARTL